MDYPTEYKNAQNTIDSRLEVLKNMRETCERQKRLPTGDERDSANKMLAEIDKLESRQKVIQAMPGDPPDKPAIDTTTRTTHSTGYESRSYLQEKKFNDLFGSGKNPIRSWNDQTTNFYMAVAGGRYHPELDKRAMNEGTPSDGGFLVNAEMAKSIFDVALEDEVIMPRATVQPMSGLELKIPAMEIGDHSSSLYGGFTASFTPEAGTMTEANPQVRQMLLRAHKLTGFIKVSSELFNDAGNFGKINQIIGAGLAWYRDKSLIGGSGAGEPQGLLTASCAISQAKEAGQAAETIVLENVVNMLARLYPAGYKRATWLVSPTCLSQLLILALNIGTGGSASMALKETAKGYTLFGIPVVFTEHCKNVGTVGDIILADLSQQVVGVREEIRIDVSSHVYFSSDEMAMRVISRFDGQSLWDAPMTMSGSSTTVSPIITLAERA